MFPPFKVWAPTAPGWCVLGCNTNYIPTRTPVNEPALPRIDGTWGPHDYTTIPQTYDAEAPYLAWCPRKSHPDQHFDTYQILDFAFTDWHYVKNPLAPKLGGLQKETHRAFHAEVEKMVQMYERAAEMANMYVPTVVHPAQALECMRQSVVYLNLQDIYCRDCREAVETLRRNTREVLAFVLWARALPSTSFPDVPFPVRGSIANDQPSYLYLCERNVPAWLAIKCADRLTPNPVRITPLSDMCSLMTWRDVTTIDVTCKDWEDRDGVRKLTHTKPLWFYPPVVREPAAFERAARGRHVRDDKLNVDNNLRKDQTDLQSKPFIVQAQSLRLPPSQEGEHLRLLKAALSAAEK